jgi:hypothetical protein
VVRIPTPTQPGITTDCNLFHSVVAGDVCESIATAADISLADFYGAGNDNAILSSLVSLRTTIIHQSTPHTYYRHDTRAR